MYVSLINAIICSLFLIELEIIRCFVAGNYTRGLFFIKIMSCERAGGICTRADTAREARVFIKLAGKRESGKTRVASMRATDWANVWAIGRLSMRSRGGANGMIG